LGSEYEAMIGTVRNVGYRFVTEVKVADTGADSEIYPDSLTTAKPLH
jgi:DNA-binding winged helix-turn-helix (wHTH) protein